MRLGLWRGLSKREAAEKIFQGDRDTARVYKGEGVTINIFTVLGSFGVLLIVASYLLLIMGRVSSEGIRYPAVNAIGAILIIISLIDSFNLPALLIEIFWLAISILGIWKSLRSDPQRSKVRIGPRA